VALKLLLKKAAVFSSGNLIGIVVGIISFPLLSIFYSPEEFGRYSLFLYSAGVVATISTLKLELSLSSETDDKEAEKLFFAGAWIPILFGFTTAILLIIFTQTKQNLTFYLFSIFYVCSFGWLTILTAWFVRINKFWLAGNLGLIYSTSILGFQLILATHMGEDGLYLGNILGGLIPLLFAAIFHHKRTPFNLLVRLNFRQIVEVLRSNSNLLGMNTAQSLVNASSLALLAYGVSIVGGMTAMGFFSTCQKVLVLPVRLLGNAMRQSMLQGLATMPAHKAHKLAINATTFLIPVSILVFTALNFVLPTGITKFMSDEWHGTEKFLVPMSIWLVVTIIYVPAIAWLNVRKQVWPHLTYEVANLIGRGSIIILALYFSWGIDAFIWATSLLTSVFGIIFCLTAFSKKVTH
jgi:O-antigen/teichoic acid export membrane protein